MAKKSPPGQGLVPAAARAGKTSLATAAPPQLVLDAVTLCETALGGRNKLIEALAAAPTLPPDLYRVLTIISDPENVSEPLALLCKEAQISPGDLFAAFGAAVKTLEEIVAMTTAVRAMPATVEDVASQCVTREATCETCDGLTTVVPLPTKKNPNPGPVPCPTCRGKGKVVLPSSLDHQRLLLEYTGALKKSGVTVNTQVNNLQGGGSSGGALGGSLEQLQQAVTETLYGRHALRVELPDEAGAVDAEIVTPTAPAPHSAPPE